MDCFLCEKPKACLECCDVKICLLDFLCSMHATHFEKSKIIDKEQFNKDLEYCKKMKLNCELSLSSDIRKVNNSSTLHVDHSKRSVASSANAWDMNKQSVVKSRSIIDMSNLPSVPSIEKNENDAFPAIIAKLLTRTLKYRYETMPDEMQMEVIDFYRAESPSYSSLSDYSLFLNELGGIVMQSVSVILNKGKRDELWLSQPNTESRKLEMSWPRDKQLKQWVRSLDYNLLTCDDTVIIQDILMRKVLDITIVDFSHYFSYYKSLKLEGSYLSDNRQLVDRLCSKCGHPQILRFAIKEYIPISTHDEIWVNKDSTDYLVEFTCPQCGYQFRSENWLE